jgi:uncharacterized protein YceK
MRSILLCVIVVCLVGVQSGCVTAFVMEEIFSTEGETDLEVDDSRPPSAGWLLQRVGFVALVLPFSLGLDAVIAVSFGWLIYDDDDDEQEEELEDCRVPPALVQTAGS